jgi:hypothetical protein
MSTTRIFIMPSGPIGTVGEDGSIQLNEPFFKYIGGIEDVTGRVADYVDPSTATAAQIVNALIAAKLMKAE